jgi:hypothetical protein
MAFRRHKIQLRIQFYSCRHRRNVGDVWEDRWKEHITAAKTSGHGVICCLRMFLAGTNNTSVWKQIMLLRPRTDWSVGLAYSTIVQLLAMFVHQLCTKVQIWYMKDGLGVRIYNLRKCRLFVSLSIWKSRTACTIVLFHISSALNDSFCHQPHFTS